MLIICINFLYYRRKIYYFFEDVLRWFDVFGLRIFEIFKICDNI